MSWLRVKWLRTFCSPWFGQEEESHEWLQNYSKCPGEGRGAVSEKPSEPQAPWRVLLSLGVLVHWVWVEGRYHNGLEAPSAFGWPHLYKSPQQAMTLTTAWGTKAHGCACLQMWQKKNKNQSLPIPHITAGSHPLFLSVVSFSNFLLFIVLPKYIVGIWSQLYNIKSKKQKYQLKTKTYYKAEISILCGK